MNSDLRKNISELRLKGYGYKAIAKELGVSSDSVKGYCKRNHLTGPTKVVSLNYKLMKEISRLCDYCNNAIKQKKRGRTKRFCCEECRRKWWNENQDKRNKKVSAIYKYICPHCGKEFCCYGNKKRKYCSHNCYIKSRFWKDEEDGI